MTFQRWSASSVSQFIADRSSHYTHGDKACRKICQCNKSNDSNRGTIVYGISSQVEQMGIDISCNGLILQIERIRKLRSDKHNSKWDCRSYELKNSLNPLLQLSTLVIWPRHWEKYETSELARSIFSSTLLFSVFWECRALSASVIVLPNFQGRLE
jgi:hypothetical protein